MLLQETVCLAYDLVFTSGEVPKSFKRILLLHASLAPAVPQQTNPAATALLLLLYDSFNSTYISPASHVRTCGTYPPVGCGTYEPPVGPAAIEP